MPIPVTTTRRTARSRWCGGFRGDHAIDRCRQFRQRLHVGHRFLRNGNAKLVLELEEELEESERIDAELIHRRVLVDRVRLTAKLLCGKLLDAGQGIHDSGWALAISKGIPVCMRVLTTYHSSERITSSIGPTLTSLNVGIAAFWRRCRVANLPA